MKEGKSEYKPCPFCGSEKINIKALSSGGWHSVECSSCHVSTPFFETLASAAKVWNRRENEQKPEGKRAEKINQGKGMKQIYVDSHFELVSGAVLPSKKIVQIWPEKVCENDAGFAVFLCEVEGLPSEE